jgi:hypothetical protein
MSVYDAFVPPYVRGLGKADASNTQSIYADVGNVQAVSDSSGACWDFDKVKAANIPVFITDTGPGAPVLLFTEGVVFNMLNVGLEASQSLQWSIAQSCESGSQTDTLNVGQDKKRRWIPGSYMTETNAGLGKENGKVTSTYTATTSQGNGLVAYYSFERYVPTSGQYAGSTTPKILIKVVQQLLHVNSKRTEGYLDMLPESDFFKSQVVSRDAVVAKNAHFGVFQTPGVSGRPCLNFAYTSDECVSPQLMMFLASADKTTIYAYTKDLNADERRMNGPVQRLDLNTYTLDKLVSSGFVDHALVMADGRQWLMGFINDGCYISDDWSGGGSSNPWDNLPFVSNGGSSSQQFIKGIPWTFKGLINSPDTTKQNVYYDNPATNISNYIPTKVGGPIFYPVDLVYDTSTMLASDAAVQAFALTPSLWPFTQWQLYLPVNPKGSFDMMGGNMFELNRDDAIKTYLLTR